jgi:catechol 2,3-dioxygenase-like lactoylglutathione lyase family enzyme
MVKLKPGINHIECWVRDMKRSQQFYAPIFEAAGWRKLGDGEFSSGETMIYFLERPVTRVDTAGPRHICLQAVSREVVDQVGKLLAAAKATVLRGPMEMPEYSPGYYTVDFRDPDGYIVEVAHTPNMVL